MNIYNQLISRALKVRRDWAAQGQGQGQGRGGASGARSTNFQVFDCKLEELQANPVATVQEMYRAFGLELDASAQSRMEQWLQNEGKRNKFGAHRYNISTFGLRSSRNSKKNNTDAASASRTDVESRTDVDEIPSFREYRKMFEV